MSPFTLTLVPPPLSWILTGLCRRVRSYKSVDGRTTPLLCGTNPPTPQPASPDPGHCPMLHDYSHVPSPMSPASPDTTSNPHTPCSRDSHRLLSSEDTRCSTPDFTFEERVCTDRSKALTWVLGRFLFWYVVIPACTLARPFIEPENREEAF